MSYPYSAHAIDLAKLSKVAGSKDAKLKAALAKKYKDEIAENAEWFADEIAKGAPKLDQAIAEIIDGTAPKKSKHGFQYGYALEKLVEHLGERIDEDELGLGAGDCLEPFLKKAKQPSFAKLTKNLVYPIAIPKPADFPDVSTMTPKDIAGVIEALDAIDPLIEDDDVEEVSAALRSWCTKAAKKKRGLVLFAY